MNPHVLKIVGVSLSALGSLILAMRVSKILNAVSNVLEFHEMNIQQLMKEVGGRNQEDVFNFANSPQQVKEAKRIGGKLLVLGFTLLFIGNSLSAIAGFLDAD